MELVDIRLLDHFVVGDSACVSLAARGLTCPDELVSRAPDWYNNAPFAAWAAGYLRGHVGSEKLNSFRGLPCLASVRSPENARCRATTCPTPTTKPGVAFLPNVHPHRFWLDSEQRYVKLKVSSKGLRIIDKHGIEKVLADLRKRGEKV